LEIEHNDGWMAGFKVFSLANVDEFTDGSAENIVELCFIAPPNIEAGEKAPLLSTFIEPNVFGNSPNVDFPPKILEPDIFSVALDTPNIDPLC